MGKLYLSVSIFLLNAFWAVGQQTFVFNQVSAFVTGQTNSTSNLSLSGTPNSSNTHEAVSVAISAKGKLAIGNYGSTTGRVMLWNSLPTSTGTSANVVVGKGDFLTTNTVGGSSGNNRIRNGADVCFSPDGSKMIVADEVNNRVLIWNTVPTTNGVPADVVLGQPDFVTVSAGLSRRQFDKPCKVMVSPDGRLLVADRENNRVLVFNKIPQSNFDSADVVIGQPNFTTKATGTGPDGLNKPLGLTLSRSGKLFVSESGGNTSSDYSLFNNRILVFDSIPLSNQASATQVLGNSSLNGPVVYADNPNSPNRETSANTFNKPRGMATSSFDKLAIADERSHRVGIYNSIPTGNFAAMNTALGVNALNQIQPQFGFQSSGLPDSINMASPFDVEFDVYERLWVAGSANTVQGNMNRVMTFGSLPTCQSDVSVDLRILTDSLCSIGSIQFLLTVRNRGPQSASNVVATAALPPYFRLNRFATFGPASTYFPGSGQLVINSMANGDSVQLFLEGSIRTFNNLPDTVYAYSGIIGTSCLDPNFNNNGDLERFRLNPALPPVNDTIIGLKTACQGQSAIYYASRDTFTQTFVWNVVNASFQVLNARGDSIRVNFTTDSLAIISLTRLNPTCSRTLSPAYVQVNGLPRLGTLSGALNVCPGLNNTYRALNVVPADNYRWKLNGTTVQNSSSDSVVLSFLTSPQQITVIPSYRGCSNDSLTASISVLARATAGTLSAPDTVCTNSTDVLTVTGATNTTAYQWTITGAASFSGSGNTRSIVSGSGNYSVSVVLLNGTCAGDTLRKTVSVRSSIVPAISISGPSGTICSGNPVTLRAVRVNGGGGGNVVWFRNGIQQAVPVNSDTFLIAAPVNNDSIVARLTSSFSCASPTVVVSNSIRLNVIPTVTPDLILAADSLGICNGDSISISATINAGGNSPTIQWFRSGFAPLISAGPIRYRPVNSGDSVFAILTSNALCASRNQDTSNVLRFNVINRVTPTALISTPLNSICLGDTITISSSVSGGGTIPRFNWLRNNTGFSNANSVTLSNLNNGDSIALWYTSNAICRTSDSVKSNTIRFTVSNVLTPTLSIAANDSSVCAGTPVRIIATTTNRGTSGTLSWRVNNNPFTAGDTLILNNPTNGTVVTAFMVSSISCVTADTVFSTPISIQVTPVVIPSISISADSTATCPGDSVTLNSLVTNGGTSPLIQWRLNGNPIGSGNSIRFAPLSSGNQITARLISNAVCAIPDSAVSTPLTFTVLPVPVPAITISAPPAPVCSGSTPRLIATRTNGGAGGNVVWFRNGVALPIPVNSDTLLLASPQNNDSIVAVLTSSLSCATPRNVNSNSVVLNVLPLVTPDISISGDSLGVCNGDSITINASLSSGGTSPSVVWYFNGIPAVITPGPIRFRPTITGDSVYAVLTSNASCLTRSADTSNALRFNVINRVTPTAQLTTPTTTLCIGDTANIQALVSGGGTNPVYHWFLNNVSIPGTDSLSLNNLVTGDSIHLWYLSNALCRTTDSVRSNSLAFVVSSVLVPSISVQANDSSICSGTPVTVIATTQNQGPLGTIGWSINGSPVPGNDTLQLTNPADGSVISAYLISSFSCASVDTAFSTEITLQVTPSVTPSISIASDSTSVCEGTSVLVRSNLTNPGSAPLIEWRLNGTVLGNADSVSFIPTQTGDQLIAVLESNAVCANPDSVSSNILTFNVFPYDTPVVQLLVSDSTLCSGITDAIFTLQITQAGTNPSITWVVNNTPSPGGDDTLYLFNVVNGTTVSGFVTSTSVCPGPGVESNAIVMSIVNLPDTPKLSYGDNYLFNLTPYNGVGRQWFKDGNLLTGETSDTLLNVNLSDSAVYQFVVTDTEGCSNSAILTTPVKDAANCGFGVFPNPFGKELTIQADLRIAEKAGIYDINGNLMTEFKITQCPEVVNLEWLDAGMYTFRIRHSLGTASFKIVKVK